MLEDLIEAFRDGKGTLQTTEDLAQSVRTRIAQLENSPNIIDVNELFKLRRGLDDLIKRTR